MAIYKVNPDGNAPKEAKAGDYVATAGGTYEVLDGAKYSGMSKAQLASAGVGFNPASGLYSRKVQGGQGLQTGTVQGWRSDMPSYSASTPYPSGVSTSISSSVSSPSSYGTLPSSSGSSSGLSQSSMSITPLQNQVRMMDSSYLNDWLTQTNSNAIARLDSAFAANRDDLYNAYNTSLADYENQKKDVRQNYLYNIDSLYKDTYYNNNKLLENASNRGLTSAGLGNAMMASNFVNAANQNSLLRSQRDTDVNKVNTNINALRKNLGVDLNALKSKMLSDKITALSDNEKKYIEALMGIDEANAKMYNDAMSNQYQLDFSASEAQKARDFEAAEAQKARDYETAMYERKLADSDNYGGGYGGYGGSGGYGGGGYGYSGGYGGGYSGRGYSNKYGRGYGNGGYNNNAAKTYGVDDGSTSGLSDEDKAALLWYNFKDKGNHSDEEIEAVGNLAKQVGTFGTGVSFKDVFKKVMQIDGIADGDDLVAPPSMAQLGELNTGIFNKNTSSPLRYSYGGLNSYDGTLTASANKKSSSTDKNKTSSTINLVDPLDAIRAYVSDATTKASANKTSSNSSKAANAIKSYVSNAKSKINTKKETTNAKKSYIKSVSAKKKSSK